MNFISKFLDPSKFTMVSDQAFNYFDKDKSGFIDSTEVTAAAQQACKLAGYEPSQSQIDSVFGRVSGPDGKVSKQEFGTLVQQLLAKLSGGGGGGAHTAETAQTF
eukprot:jgi/Chrzof1/10749/Cz05g10290.t1